MTTAASFVATALLLLAASCMPMASPSNDHWSSSDSFDDYDPFNKETYAGNMYDEDGYYVYNYDSYVYEEEEPAQNRNFSL